MILIWDEPAVRDLQDIFDFIVEESPQNALLVDARICEQTDELAMFPSMGRAGTVSGTRELVIKKTPYIAVYRVEENEIHILRVLHGSQQWPTVF